ncbi:MAG TPA: efflux RND transporter periplasmic adaptor subunit [Candidatus Sulfotelmatobacter sp.]|nr:efflux RND transporter periplasmic adaptor subunit [Candidatus Sulfotelmatobacter sp.]HWI55651.1 efflux RND transporter periplasmic adaptor subunit [Bacillota bacterium]
MVPWMLCLMLALGLGSSIVGCKKKRPAPPTPTVVQVLTVTPRDVPIFKEWIGTLEGQVNAEIRAQVAGYLLSQNYSEGTEVQKGDLLFQIDPRPFQAALDQALGKLAQSQAQESRTRWDVERYEPLAKQNAISQQEYNNAVQSNLAAKAQVKADEAAVETARLNLGFTRVTSPIIGLAGVAQAQIGDLVGPNGPILTTVSTINPIKVYFNASEQSYLAYRHQYTNATERATHEQGLELHLILADGSVYPLSGKFAFAGREVNPTTGTIQLVGLFPNPNFVLRPGQFARVRAETQVRKGALLVPQRAVTELQGGYQIAVVDNQNKVHLQPVTVGEQVGSDWVIEKGLQPGQQVIVEGAQKAKEGMVVKPQPFVPASERAVASSP